MLVYWVLVALYAFLILFYIWCRPNVVVHAWPPLDVTPPSETATTCKDTSECPPEHCCIKGRCIPLFISGEECNPATGKWITFEWKGQTFAICRCLDPNLVTQKHFGGNCNVDVACAPHGRYNIQTEQCDCDRGYLRVSSTLVPTCRRMTAMERKNFWPCGPNEISRDEIKDSDGFAPEYLKAHADKKCFKRPCTFDILSGKPLKHARYEEGVGCDCGPQWGQFGVRLQTDGEYVRGDGPNACASLYGSEIRTHTKLFSYFYMLRRNPVSMISYDIQWTELLQEPFRSLMKGNRHLQIGQEWPHDPIQQFFRRRNVKPYEVRTRRCYVGSFFFIETCDEWLMQQNVRPLCRNISNNLNKGKNKTLHSAAYELLYEAPVCFIDSHDEDVPEKYRGRFVSNPYHMTLQTEPKLMRSNGIRLEFKENKWHLDFADGYDVQTYKLGIDPSNVPNLHDHRTDFIP